MQCPNIKETYDQQNRLTYMAGALLTGELQNLLTINDQTVECVLTEASRSRDRLMPEEEHHLQKTAEGMSVNELSSDWRFSGGSKLKPVSQYNRTIAVRKELFEKFNAVTSAHLVTVACSLGRLACPPLELTTPIVSNVRKIVTLGLLGRGLSTRHIQQTAKVNTATQVTNLCMAFKNRLPAGEIAPRGNSVPWRIYIALRYNTLPHSPDTLENLDVDQLYQGVAALMDPSRPFCIPSHDSPVMAAAAPFIGV